MLVHYCVFGCIFHIMLYIAEGGAKGVIDSDLEAIRKHIHIKIPSFMLLLYQLHNNRYYRNFFYHRIGIIPAAFLSQYKPGDKYFNIANATKLGKGMWIAHPYATILNAISIGDNFHCLHCTMLGATDKGMPTIGNNVTLGANTVIIGPVNIGNNVTIGAGSVVVKDIPDNCIAVGNPCKPIKFIDNVQ